MDILCVGLAVCDVLAKPVRPDALIADTSRLDSLELRPGGDAMNVACNLARQGVDVALVGRVGNDGFGAFLREELTAAGARDLLVVDPECATSTSLALLEENGERHFLYYGRTNDRLCPSDIDPALFENLRHLHVGSAMALAGLDGDGLAELFKLARAKGATTSLDCTEDHEKLWYAKIAEALPYVTHFLPSYNEAAAIAGASSLPEIERFFQTKGISVLAVKLGEKGSIVTDFTNRYEIPAYPAASVVDTTGAGDAYVSGFLHGVLDGAPIDECARRGSYLGAHTVGSIGAHVPAACHLSDMPR